MPIYKTSHYTFITSIYRPNIIINKSVFFILLAWFITFNMDYLKIPLTKKQLSLLKRIAKADDRRLEDLINLLFSCGLSVYFCESSICISKNDDEYTEAEIKQKAFNDKLLKDNPKFYYQTQEEQKAQGYIYVDNTYDNYNKDNDFIEKLANEIKQNALKKINEDLKEIEKNITKENIPGQLVQTFTSSIDSCKYDYFIYNNILSYRVEGTSNWQDFIPNNRELSKEQVKEFNTLLKEVCKDE